MPRPPKLLTQVCPLGIVLAGMVVLGPGCASVKSGNGGVPGADTGTGSFPSAGASPTGSGGAAGLPSVDGGTAAATGRGTMISSNGAAGGCTNLQCQQTSCKDGACAEAACPTGQTTSISGTVYDPAGATPLYNVVVYVPNAGLADIPEGVSCQKCDGTASGSPITTALTDATGHFVLDDMPVGHDIPLVIQVGKWRRQVTIPTVTACQDTPITDKNLTRLPRNQSEGHLPRFALTTGHADALECLLRKIGIADEEFTTDAGTGRVDMFVGGATNGDGSGSNAFASGVNGGAAFPSASTLWGSPDKLRSYDILVLSCEGASYADAKDPYRQNIKAYADMGGRLFADHKHSYWLASGAAPWPQTAVYKNDNNDLPDPTTLEIDDSFPKGAALADWLVNTGASTTRGKLQVFQGQYSVEAVTPPYTQRWIYYDAEVARPGVEYMTMNTPVESPADQQCGRVVFTDVHVVSSEAGGAVPDVSSPDKLFPTGCTSTTLSPQEKALEFMLFDLSSCIQPETVRPVPPAPE
jgi:hypothetical protein